MPASQLKRLRASLREEGVIGPQKPKTKRKRQAGNGGGQTSTAHRMDALRTIREQFNPFESQQPKKSKGKFEATSAQDGVRGLAPKVKGRPGVTKGHGEEKRKQTLLKEMHQRNKVGGIVDRRFGENDPSMTPEERMLQRFVTAKQTRFKNRSVFNLEDDQEEELTHFGQSLSLRDNMDNVSDVEDSHGKDEDDQLSVSGFETRKRKQSMIFDGVADDEDQDGLLVDRQKSRTEVMKEVMAKSKLYKYERQQVKENDEEETENLDKELSGLLQLMKPLPKSKGLPSTSLSKSFQAESLPIPERDREYDKQVKEMLLDRRSKPTERTKTEEEKAAEEASRLRELEEGRLRRMRGEKDAGESDEDDKASQGGHSDQDSEDDAKAFGLGSGVAEEVPNEEKGVEDEDEFLLDRDLIASDSDADLTDSDGNSDSEAASSLNDEDEEEDREFIGGLMDEDGARNLSQRLGTADEQSSHLPYVYPCPSNHQELLEMTKDIPVEETPTVVRRIRALYSPELKSDNKSKLGTFATVLVEHIVYLANQPYLSSMAVVETLIRHIHSLAKTYPIGISSAFRAQLKSLQETRANTPTSGDLTIFIAIMTIFPTSDHFHPVVTPASLSMARYLGQARPGSLSDMAMGACVATLFLQYQSLSKRYIPELINYVLNAIWNLAPTKPDAPRGALPIHELSTLFRISEPVADAVEPLRFRDLVLQESVYPQGTSMKADLLLTFVSLLDEMARLCQSHSAFDEVFTPALDIMQHLQRENCQKKLGPLNKRISKTASHLQALLDEARLSRRPLALHYHRPLAIKMSIPKFEESYNPTKHYDPDRDRQEFNKLKAEHKRERKAALRELRKDASFIARESLREKKEKDEEYNKKFKRLVAEIQGEEGKEAKLYEREKRLRKQKR
ncbi:MAG: hypothetical protein M1823_001386 [Watsoniomyces obsoletus]|nr:MAG: hypothetical protein M1823_001386 [Watsoniomyces obsoletus]